jgi:thiamine-monophosphate kinase
MDFSEEQVIALLAEIFASSDSRLIVGIGDDAAVVQANNQQILTTDIAVEGVHFKREWSTPYEIGRRVVAANIADVMSMNGKCEYLLVAVTLTGSESMEWIESLARGIQSQASEAGAIVVGGDLARSNTLTISITAVGKATTIITRGGAQVGDGIYLSHLTGWSAAGLEILSRGLTLSSSASERALTQYKSPTLDLSSDFSQATSMSDVSDAVLIQGAQMAKASGVRFELSADLIQASEEFTELYALAEEMGADVWSWILQGGEDHCLLATGKDLPGLCIGRVCEGEGIFALNNDGEIKMAPVAWSHFQ